MSEPSQTEAPGEHGSLVDVYDAYLEGYLGNGRVTSLRGRGEPGFLAAALGRRDAAIGLAMRSVDQVRRWSQCCAAYVAEHQRCSRGEPGGQPPGEREPAADPAVTLIRLIARRDAATRNLRSPVELAELLRRVGEHG